MGRFLFLNECYIISQASTIHPQLSSLLTSFSPLLKVNTVVIYCLHVELGFVYLKKKSSYNKSKETTTLCKLCLSHEHGQVLCSSTCHHWPMQISTRSRDQTAWRTKHCEKQIQQDDRKTMFDTNNLLLSFLLLMPKVMGPYCIPQS